MKDILIVAKPYQDPSSKPYNTIQKEAQKYKGDVKEIFETAFLISGTKSFEIAMQLCRIGLERGTPFAVFEIESCLLVPKEA